MLQVNQIGNQDVSFGTIEEKYPCGGRHWRFRGYQKVWTSGNIQFLLENHVICFDGCILFARATLHTIQEKSNFIFPHCRISKASKLSIFFTKSNSLRSSIVDLYSRLFFKSTGVLKTVDFIRILGAGQWVKIDIKLTTR